MHEKFLWIPKENTIKIINFKNTLPIETEVTTIDRIGDDITKNISYTLQLIDSARFIIKAHYQILPITFLKVLKEFIELNVDSEMMIKNLKLVELNKSISTVFFLIYKF